MKVSGNAIVLTNGKFDTKSAKTAHGLIRGSKRFIIKSVIDDKFHTKYVHSNKYGNVFMSSTKSKIPVFIGKDRVSVAKFLLKKYSNYINHNIIKHF